VVGGRPSSLATRAGGYRLRVSDYGGKAWRTFLRASKSIGRCQTFTTSERSLRSSRNSWAVLSRFHSKTIRICNALGLLQQQVRGDLARFKELIESRGEASGAWRGEVKDGDTT
jgi:hypothetical protein